MKTRVIVALVVLLWSTACRRETGTRTSQLASDTKAPTRIAERDDAYERARAYAAMYGQRPTRRLSRAKDLALFNARSSQVEAGRFGALLTESTPGQIDARIKAARARLKARRARISLQSQKFAARGDQNLAARWVNLGPNNVAGRVSSIGYSSSTPGVIFRGAAGGGVWRSTDDGVHWVPLTETLGSLSIGAIALAPSNPHRIYVGTGEGSTSGDATTGIGLIVSTNDGLDWTLRTAAETHAPIPSKFYDISVHPSREMEALTATDLGIQRTTNGGATWSSPLTATTVTSLARSTQDPEIVLAGGWKLPKNAMKGPGQLYRSTDGGGHWTVVGGVGVSPFSSDTGRLSVAFAARSDVAYAIASSAVGNALSCKGAQDMLDQTGIYKSTDAGKTWRFMGNYHEGSCETQFAAPLGALGWYSNALTVDPNSPDVLFAGGLDLWRSADSGATWKRESDWRAAFEDPQFVHADVHALVWANNGLLIATDGGLHRRVGIGVFMRLDDHCPTRQYYSVAVNDADPDFVIGAAQDNGINLRNGATDVFEEGVCGKQRCTDGIMVAVASGNPPTIYATEQFGDIYRKQDGLKFERISPNYDPQIEAPPFMTPLVMAADAPSVMATGTQYVHLTIDGARYGAASWKRLPHNFDDENGGNYITAIALADKGHVIVVGTASGLAARSTDQGVTWTDLMLPPGFITHVEIDRSDSKVFYVAYGHDDATRVIVTNDGGARFRTISTGLPASPVHVVRIGPSDRNSLYAGTDYGLFVSRDRGLTWKRDETLPAISVWDLCFTRGASRLLVATHGRGFFERTLSATPH